MVQAGYWVLNHLVLAGLGAFGIAICAGIGTHMVNRRFGSAEPKKSAAIQRTKNEMEAIFEVVNNGTRDIVIRKYGVKYYDGKDDFYRNADTRIKEGDHMPLKIDDVAWHFYKYDHGAVWYIYAEETDKKVPIRYYPDGWFARTLKRQWHTRIKQEYKLPPLFDPVAKNKKEYP